MSLRDLLIFAIAAVILRLAGRGKARTPLLAAASVLAIYWLQPLSAVRYLDFWLPTLTLALTAAGWYLTASPEQRSARRSRLILAALAGAVLLIAATRYLNPTDGILTAGRPPELWQVIIGLALIAGLVFVAARPSVSLFWGVGLLVTLLVVLKSPELARLVSAGLRGINQQNTALASALDLRWLGFSYVAFRLIHTFRDRQAGRLPAVELDEYLTFVIFFPAFTAGPIDRVDRFIKDLRQPAASIQEDIAAALPRLFTGLLKKFVAADGLALFALSAGNYSQVSGGVWAWVMVYAYAFQIYFDFAGYTDLAVAVGRVLGVRLPDNFKSPYLKTNLTTFWNNWHITLTMWFRAYYFNPLTRWLRSKHSDVPAWGVLLITQLSTMALIGLWHGVTWNYLIWGAWHGLGLFINNRFGDWAKPYWARLAEKPRLHAACSALATLITFNYVALGWVWFVLPDPAASLTVLARLF